MIRNLSSYSFLLPFFLLLPGITIGARTIYPFEFITPFLFVSLFNNSGISVSRAKLINISTLLFFSSIIIIIQLFSYNNTKAFYLIRMGFLFLIPTLFSGFSINNEMLKKSILIVFMTIICLGYGQLLDTFLLGNKLGINKLVATLYPYSGELSSSSLSKTGNLQLKTNSILSPTSIVDGHTILAGNLFSIISIVFLYLRKNLFYVLGALLTILTFSRGSWAMLILGSTIFFWENRKSITFVKAVKAIIILPIIILVIRMTTIWDYLNFRIINTLYVFGFTDIGVGNRIDPRTSEVWPFFIDKMNESGILSWIIGGGVDVFADSGYLTLIRDSGVLSILLLLIFYWEQYLELNKPKLLRSLLFCIALGSIVNPIFQGYRLLYTFSLIVTLLNTYKKYNGIN